MAATAPKLLNNSIATEDGKRVPIGPQDADSPWISAN
jgi:hypothetical protein